MKNHSKHSSVILNKADNVALALRDLKKGELSRGVKLQEYLMLNLLVLPSSSNRRLSFWSNIESKNFLLIALT